MLIVEGVLFSVGNEHGLGSLYELVSRITFIIQADCYVKGKPDGAVPTPSGCSMLFYMEQNNKEKRMKTRELDFMEIYSKLCSCINNCSARVTPWLT